LSRDQMNDLLSDKMGLFDPIQIVEFGYDEMSEQFLFRVEASDNDVIKMELAGAEIEA
jgi:hypothetical protein